MSEHSFKELRTDIRKYNLKATLRGINSVAAQIDSEDGRIKWMKFPNPQGGQPLDVAVATHSLASATKVALYASEHWASRRPNVRDIVRFQNWVSALPSHFTSDNGHSINQLMFQTAYQQFPFQEKDEWQNLGRVLTLLRDIPEQMKKRGIEVPFDLPAEFAEYTGMPIEQFIWTGLTIFSAAMEGKLVNLPYVDNESEQARWHGPSEHRPTVESVEQLLQLTARSPNEFKKLIGNLADQDERTINLDFQPLLTYPIVRLSARQIIIPVPKLLLDRVTLGIFHDFAEHLSERDKADPFRQFFGDLFEDYVRQQLELVFDKNQLIYETQYGSKSKPKTTPDWYVEDGERDLALECKSSTFRLGTRTAADHDDLAKDLKRIATDGIRQIRSKVADIRSGDSIISTEESTSIEQIICTYESINVLGLLGVMIVDQLDEMDESTTGFHLVPMKFLEQMCAYQDREVFFKALDVLFVDDSWRDWRGPGIQDKFRDSLPSKYMHNPIIGNAADEFLSAVEIGASEPS